MSLSSLPGLRSPDYQSDDSDDSQSECSYYSLPELPEDEPVRRITAAEVRRQAAEVPLHPMPGTKYPERLLNIEELPLRVCRPWIEHPLLPSGSYRVGIPGAARVVVNAHRIRGCDVVYHPNGLTKFLRANYRPSGYRPVKSGQPIAANGQQWSPTPRQPQAQYRRQTGGGYRGWNAPQPSSQEPGQRPWEKPWRR